MRVASNALSTWRTVARRVVQFGVERQVTDELEVRVLDRDVDPALDVAEERDVGVAEPDELGASAAAASASAPP